IDTHALLWTFRTLPPIEARLPYGRKASDVGFRIQGLMNRLISVADFSYHLPVRLRRNHVAQTRSGHMTRTPNIFFLQSYRLPPPSATSAFAHFNRRLAEWVSGPETCAYSGNPASRSAPAK